MLLVFTISALFCKMRVIRVGFGFVVILWLGFLSSLMAVRPIYALVELILIILAYLVFVQSQSFGIKQLYIFRFGLAETSLVFSILYGVLFYFSFFSFLASLPVGIFFRVDIVPLYPFVENVRYINSAQVILIFLPWLTVRLKQMWGMHVLFALLASSLTLSLLLIGGARSGLLSVLLGLVVLFFTGKNKRAVLIYSLISIVLALLLYFFTSLVSELVFNKGFTGDFFSRFGAGQLNSINAVTSSRYDLWVLAIKVAISNPLFGIGPQHFASLSSFVAHPHNFYLNIAAEWGIPALLLLVYLTYKYYRHLFQCLGGQVLLAVMVAILCDALWSGNTVYPISQMYILLVAMLVPPYQSVHGFVMSQSLTKAVAVTLAIGLVVLSVITFQSSLLELGEAMPRFWIVGTF